MTLLRGATLVEFDPPSVEKADIRIVGDSIAERGKGLQPAPEETVVDLDGHLILPGLVCSHTHLYSALARGMPGPSQAPKNFHEILQRIWWVLDRALDPGSIAASGRVGALAAAASGTTMLVDHHASPESIPGSLELLREGLTEIGIRGVLCYEITDRGGPEQRDLGLAENIRFIESTRSDSRFRGLMGAHASFTLGDESLQQLVQAARSLRTPIHIHVAEDPCDFPRGGGDGELIGRLADAGVLDAGGGALLGHGTHLGPDALSRVRDSGCWLIHNARSNMNNHVGYAPVEIFPEIRCGLGTDGIDGDVFAEAQTAFFKNQDAGGALLAEGILRMIAGGHRLAQHLFERPYGTLRPDAPADLAVLDYPSPTPLTSENLAWHLIFGMSASDCVATYVAGRLIYDRGHFPLADREAIHRTAHDEAARLWKRMQELS
ncbi:MAG: amidohydrolase family protein [Planctomycetota bacterium]|jgi:putative selenium metabolism protein SsnA|nr:amidohydrolase family protein [Planctomycetota bacterium]